MTAYSITTGALRATFAAYLLAWPAGAALAAEAGDPGAGESKAQPCLSCHDLENFAGVAAADLAAKIADLPDAGHFPLPPTLTDQDLADVAAYLAAATE